MVITAAILWKTARRQESSDALKGASYQPPRFRRTIMPVVYAPSRGVQLGRIAQSACSYYSRYVVEDPGIEVFFDKLRDPGRGTTTSAGALKLSQNCKMCGTKCVH